jgi:UPF0716 protein FxsA
MLLALVLLICWPIAELFVAIKVGEAIGVLPTVLLLIVSWPAGVWTVRTHGRAAWQRLSAAIAAGRPPAKEVLDGALVLLGGGLLIVPGFITDVVGICLLLPPVRAVTRRILVRNFHSRVVVQAARFTNRGSTYDVDSTAHDVDQPRLRP